MGFSSGATVRGDPTYQLISSYAYPNQTVGDLYCTYPALLSLSIPNLFLINHNPVISESTTQTVVLTCYEENVRNNINV